MENSVRTMVYKATLKKEFGLTDKLIRELGEPDKFVKNPHYKSGPCAALYHVERVEHFIAKRGDEIAQAKKHRCPEEIESERQRRLSAKFHDWRKAILPAAALLFSLNRYAKWERCTSNNRNEIYALKNSFLKVLCDMGFMTEARQHFIEIAGKECWSCGGSVRSYEDLDNDGNDFCQRCCGTGWFRAPSQRTFLALRFQISDTTFSWHQPAELVTWPIKLTTDAAVEFTPDVEEKAILLSARKFAESKALLRFVIVAWESSLQDAKEASKGTIAQ